MDTDGPRIFDALHDAYQGHLPKMADQTYAAEQVCRTCIHDKARTTVDVYAIAQARRDGKNVAEFLEANRCSPDTHNALWRVDDASVLTRMEPDGSTRVTIGRKPNRPTKTVSLVANCGQHIAQKCRACGHFAAQTQKVPGGVNMGSGTIWYREVIVGGHCRLVDRCEPSRRPTDTIKTHSCSTCANLMSFTGDWLAEHSDPVQIDLTPYERWRLTAGITDGSAGLEIWRARQHLGQMQLKDGSYVTTGTLRIYRARLRSVEGSTVTVVFSTGIGEVTRSFDATNDDPRQGVVEVIGEHSVGILFLTPYQRLFGLDEHNFRRPLGPVGHAPCRCITDTSWWSTARNPAAADKALVAVRATGKGTPNPKCAECGGTGLVASLPAAQPTRLRRTRQPVEGCPRCTPDKACYYHAKGFSPDIDEAGLRTYGRSVADEARKELFAGIVAGVPGAHLRRAANRTRMLAAIRNHVGEANPARILHVDPDTGIVSDANGNPPDPTWLMLRVRDLIEAHPRFADDIRRQTAAAVKLAWKPQRRAAEINPGFAKPLGVQPWVPYCSANLFDPTIGLDLRAELGDWWGDPRSNQGTNPSMHYSGDNYFSRKRHAGLEEYLRVTNPGERMAEHMASTRRYIANMAPPNAHVTDVDWDNFQPRSWQAYDPFGRESYHPDYDPSTVAYRDWLDEPVTITLANDKDGETFTATRRFERYGYECFKGGKQIRRNDIAEVWSQRAAEEMDVDAEFDPEQIYVGFVCVACGATPAIDEALDHDLVCSAHDRSGKHVCGGALIWYEGRGEDAGTEMGANQIGPDETYTPKARRVINSDMVVPPDTERWQQTEMLMSLGHDCPHWRPRGPRGWSALPPPPPRQIDKSAWLGRRFKIYLPGGYHTDAQTQTHAAGRWRECDSCVNVVEITEDNLDEAVIDAIIRTDARATVSYTDRNGRPQLASILEELGDPDL